MTLIEQYEQGSIMEKENACALQCAINRLRTDLPEAQIGAASLISRTLPLRNPHLHIQGPRWYVRIFHDGEPVLYRVWQSEHTWTASVVKRD